MERGSQECGGWWSGGVAGAGGKPWRTHGLRNLEAVWEELQLVSIAVTPVVSVLSKEPQGKCCWTQSATTSTSWKATTLASSFPTTKRSR